MVGGGCLSLPLAFQQSGNALVGPLMLLVTALLTDFCFRLLMASAVHLHPSSRVRPGKDTFESITSAAFGIRAYFFSMGLVVLMCFFGAVGYSVLLQDMMEPINDVIAPTRSNWLHKNFTMFLVILLVTPFCTLRQLTALKDCGAASMTSVIDSGELHRLSKCRMQSQSQ
jgi:amino acid permease